MVPPCPSTRQYPAKENGVAVLEIDAQEAEAIQS